MTALPGKSDIGLGRKFDSVEWMSNFRKHKISLILLLVFFALSVLITSIFLIVDNNKGDNLRSQSFQKTSFLFSLPLMEERYDKYIVSAQSASDRNIAFDSYMRAYRALFAEYNNSPTAEKRSVLENLVTYLQSEFPEEAQLNQINIPCREESCGAVFDYSDGLAKLKEAIKASEDLRSELKQAVLLNIDSSALLAGKSNHRQEFHTLTGVFNMLRDEWQFTDSEEIRLLAERTLSLLKDINPDAYQMGLEDGYFNI